jgi:hypothetical protein
MSGSSGVEDGNWESGDMTSLSHAEIPYLMFLYLLLDHAIISLLWWMEEEEEAMPIMSTENTVRRYILYHHATADRHCTVTCSHVSMDLG